MLAAGIAGGYTTWSTWAWEFLALGEDGSLVELTAHIAGSLVVAWPRPIPADAARGAPRGDRCAAGVRDTPSNRALRAP